MTDRTRRRQALTKDHIVRTAIQILDSDGPDALTFRALASALSTGSGAIYHHVPGKQELLAEATAIVTASALAEPSADTDPRQQIRDIALAMFDTIDQHAWLARTLTSDPRQPANRLLLERIGSAVARMSPPDEALFDAASAITSYVLGSASQNASNARQFRDSSPSTRDAMLGDIADEWGGLPEEEFPYLRRIATTMRDHDDRAQFLAGLNLVIAGIDSL